MINWKKINLYSKTHTDYMVISQRNSMTLCDQDHRGIKTCIHRCLYVYTFIYIFILKTYLCKANKYIHIYMKTYINYMVISLRSNKRLCNQDTYMCIYSHMYIRQTHLWEANVYIIIWHIYGTYIDCTEIFLRNSRTLCNQDHRGIRTCILLQWVDRSRRKWRLLYLKPLHEILENLNLWTYTHT
jgi:hypothetical protein